MSKYKLNIYQIQEKQTLDVNLISLKDKIEAIMKIDETVSNDPAAWFEENEETPFAIAYKKANGEVVFYYPE